LILRFQSIGPVKMRQWLGHEGTAAWYKGDADIADRLIGIGYRSQERDL
jgi:hypothetical protein